MVKKEDILDWYLNTLKQMKAIKKPIPIEVEKFTGDNTNPNIQFTPVVVGDKTIYKVFNKLSNSWFEVKIGQYLSIEDEENIYLIDTEDFKNNYEIVAE